MTRTSSIFPQAAVLILFLLSCALTRGNEETPKAAAAVSLPSLTATAGHEGAPAVTTTKPERKPAKKLTPSAMAIAEAKGLLALGTRLTERSDYSAAEIAYRQILNSREFGEPYTRDALLGLASMYRIQGAHTKAAAVYEKFLKEYPDDPHVPDALLDLGRTQRAMGAYRMAIARFYSVINSTLKVQSENFDHYELLAKTAQFEIAETHFLSGDYAEAGKFFSRLRLLDLAPVDRARAHFKSAYALQLGGDLDGAVRTLRSYLEEWPKDENVPEARYLLATTLRQLNRTDEALAATLDLLRAEQAVSGSDTKRWTYWQRRTGNQLANEFFQNGDTINALSIYQGLVALSPEPAWRLPVSYQIALCYERLRLADRAHDAYQGIVDGVAELGAKGGQPVAPELTELAHMASWRLNNLAWTDQTQHQLTVYFSTTTGQRTTPTPAATAPAAAASGATVRQ